MVTLRVESGNLAQSAAKAIVVNLFEGVATPGGGTGAVDQAMGGALSQLIHEGDITGKRGEITVVHSFGRLPAGRVLVVGLGKREKFDLDAVRAVSGDVARRLRNLGVGEAATIVHGAGAGGLDAEACAQALAEGTVMGLYTFTRHKRPDDSAKELKTLTLIEFDASKVGALERGAERGRILGEAANFARDLANEPSNMMTPTELASRAEAMAAEVGLDCQVFEREQVAAMGMGSFLGVAQGSEQPPKFIVLTYKGDPSTHKGLGLIGKGITFDTGGISIKPAANMEEMKADMSGGGSVIAALGALARLRPRINVVGIVPATENMPSGTAIKPGDVVKAMNGKTIEVINTDAEGRLILADGLSYACQLDLSPLVDIATLTGAISIALGNVAMGVMANDDALVEKLKTAAGRAGEKIWQMPMFEEYKEQIKSDVADMKNTGGRLAGSITAAMLLREFVETRPWAHLDIAGVDGYERDRGEMVKGSSGIPVRTLINLALLLAEEQGSVPAK